MRKVVCGQNHMLCLLQTGQVATHAHAHVQTSIQLDTHAEGLVHTNDHSTLPPIRETHKQCPSELNRSTRIASLLQSRLLPVAICTAQLLCKGGFLISQ